MSRLIDLNERLAYMQAFKAAELKLADPSANYIADLNDSIKSVKTQIKHFQKNGDKLEVMNGGEFA